ncbi:hypothetical protein EV644_103569 [Kribbella orskensis]|uniref:Uncharacterized protein n=1 Tax=Kribbella orskensis TaxID=2512216 RepID=A0ABY2BQH3_9ACTN|nr:MULTISPECIES: hypothetical protein [Kribbella]TCN37227.1 hypothetical protein EV642_11293 [Kribbella sp. VKM Ac-2500]TCO27865.1 hypothetical protein EV644_103569 [Kribbella orskensis]
MVAPSSPYPRTAVGLAVVALAATGCITKDSNDTAGGPADDDASTGTSNGPVGLKGGSKVELAQIPGGVIVDSGSFVVTKANVDTHDTERKAKTVEVQKDFASQFSCS